MTNYEIMFIVKTTMESDKIKGTIENMKKIITDGKGKIVDTKDMGERKLAYPLLVLFTPFRIKTQCSPSLFIVQNAFTSIDFR